MATHGVPQLLWVRAEEPRQQAVARHLELRPRAGGQVAGVQADVGEDRRHQHEVGEDGAAEDLGQLDEVETAAARPHVLPAGGAGRIGDADGGEHRDEVGGDDQRGADHQRPRDDPLRVLDLTGKRGHRLPP